MTKMSCNGTGYAARTAQGIGTSIDPTTGKTEHRAFPLVELG